MAMEEQDWHLKFIGEEQRHQDTKRALLKAKEEAERWKAAYWALVDAEKSSAE